MLFAFRLTVVLAVSASCLASAFSTLFVTEAAGEGRKTEGTETKTQKTAGNSVAENQVIVETIPFFTDVFTKVEDVMNLTPLKVATIISAQYLINTVKNIPVAGNLPHDTLNMLSTIVEQFNKTTQIIKLTAEYVNISSNYILTSLNQYAKDNCDQESVKTTMKTINQNFLDVISNHVKVAVREITEKTQQREMTGTDVLVSSAYHIVAAFQEMTNLVMSLKIDHTKCDFPQTPQNSEQVESSKVENKTVNIFVRSKQDVHKSIKKDKALPQTDSIFKFPNRGNLQDSLVIENIDENPDLTIEIFPQKQLNLNNNNKEPVADQEIKIPESFKVAFLSEKTTEPKQQKLDLKNQFGFQTENNKITKKNLKNFEDIFTIESINPNQDVTLEIVSPQNLKNSNRQETGSKVNENKQQKPQGFNVYYYPLTTSLQNKNHPPNENMDKNLKVPEDFKGHYYPQTFYNEQNNNLHREKLKQTFTPFNTLSLFGNYNPENKLPNKMSEGSPNHFKKFDDKSTEVNFDRQDLTVEVFSPETFLHKGKDESSEIKQERINPQNIPSQFYRKKLDSRDFENYNYKKSPERNHFKYKKSLDRKLASSAVDSLSNVPPASYESKTEKVRNRKLTKPKVNKDSSTVLTPWSRGFQQFLSPFPHKNQQKSNACHERVEPVCGIDKNKSNFIIFLNDCQRDHHNNVYKTSYEWADMDTCVRFLLKYSSGKPTSYMNAIPK